MQLIIQYCILHYNDPVFVLVVQCFLIVYVLLFMYESDFFH